MSSQCPIIIAKSSDRLARAMFVDRPKVNMSNVNYKFLYNGALPMCTGMFNKSKRNVRECLEHCYTVFRMNEEEKRLLEWEFNYCINESLIKGDINI